METKTADLSSLKIDRSNQNDKKSFPKWIIYLILLICLAVAGYFIINSFSGQAIEVKLTTIVMQSPGVSSAVLNASGYVVAQRQASVSSKGTGVLIYLGVVEGDKVKK